MNEQKDMGHSPQREPTGSQGHSGAERVKHTSEPWEPKGLTVHCGRGTIAICPTPQNGGVFECTANRNLIVAAPDLRDVCAAFSVWSDDEGNQYFQIGGRTVGSVEADTDEARLVATLGAARRAALAKAEGRAP